MKPIKDHIPSIKDAYDGMHYAYKFEQSMSLHLISNLTVVILGLLLRFTWLEWLFCILLFGFILAIELLNTSLEAVVDLISPQIHPLAKIAKDTASASSFVLTIVTTLSLIILFIVKILNLF